MLLLFLLSVNITYASEQKPGEEPDLVATAICFFSFAAVSYLNALVITPKLLMRKHNVAFGIVTALEVLLVIVLMSLRYVFVASNTPESDGSELSGIIVEPWVLICQYLSSPLVMTLVILSTSAYVIIKKSIAQTQRIAELNNLRRETELAALQRQLSPHFIFNMLNNAITLVRISPQEGASLIAKLRSLLNYQIEQCQADMMPLESEISHLREFLEIESVRHDNIEVDFRTNGSFDGIMLPSLLFLPVVENAVKHNLPDIGTPYIDISVATTADGTLKFRCENSCGRQSGAKGGLGLKGLKRRLDLIYPGRHTIDIDHQPTKYSVSIDINTK